MRKLIVAAVAASLGGFPTAVDADNVDDLVATGEVFAKQGEWTQAITAFKAADAERPRAKHACLIGLTYTRRELWPQAEIFFARCRARLSADDPAPDWLEEAEVTLAEKLATSRSATVAITVTPPTALAQVSVSAFAPDETFAPRTIHLAPGTHTITVTAPEYVTASKTIVVDGTVTEIPISIDLVPIADRSRPSPVPTRSRIPTYVMIAGAAITAIGLTHHVVLTRPARDALADAATNADYEGEHDRFLSRRRITVALYSVGVATALTGLVLRYTVFRRTESPVQISATASDRGAMVTIGWQR